MPPRSFKPTRERKQRRCDKNHRQNDPDVNTTPDERSHVVPDSNAEIVIPLTAVEKAEKRRKQLKEELKAAQPKMSAKKQKRFNKYIETKLKNEETAAILEKLAEARVDTSLFASTKNIGASRESKKQQIKRALLEEQAGINLDENRAILYEERRIPEIEDIQDENLDQHMLDQPTDENAFERQQPQEQTKPAHPFMIGATIGAGLKRPLDGGEGGQPVIKRIKKNRNIRKELVLVVNELVDSEDDKMPTSDDESSVGDGWDRKEEEWHGFSEAEGTDSNSSSSEDSDSSDDSDDSSDSEEEAIDRLKRGQSGKANAFKEWALAQRRITVDGDTSVTKSNIVTSIELKSTIVHVSRKREEDMTPPPEELVVSQTDRKVSVGVQAPAETQG